MDLSPADLVALMQSATPHAVLDLRERAAYEGGHIFWTTSLPRRLLEFRLPTLVTAGGDWTPSGRTRSRPEDGPRLPLLPTGCAGRGSPRDGGCGPPSVAIGERPRDRDGSSLREGRLDAR